MKLLVHASGKGTNLIFEVDHKWIMVGYCHAQTAANIHALVAVEYEAPQVPYILRCCHVMRSQHRAPTVAVRDRQIQISYSLSPVTKEIRSSFAKTPLLQELTDEVGAVHVTSIGEVFPDDEAYKIFQKCFERDRSFKLMIMPPTTDVGGQAHEGRPLEIFDVRELKKEIQIFM